ncbi:MAG: 16S rRNA (uracil(1498)-N(3))-methyltransferase [Steroidobacteraceae bacterium]
MRLTRVYVDVELQTGRRLTVEGTAGNHIARVLRLRVGDTLTLFNGRGGEYAGSIEEIRRDTVVVSVLERRDVDRESPCQLSLAQGVSRGERMDWVVQKATELGVWQIAPIFTERSVVQLDAKQAVRKLQHWRSIAVAACEQSGRNRVPHITEPVRLYELLEQRTSSGTALLLSPGAPLRIADIASATADITVLIGPEGGLADVEQEAAIKTGFAPVRLGPRVLRTETAAVCALTLLQQKFGDL